VSAVHGKWAGKAQAYAETFAPLCAELVDPLLNVLAPAPGERLLDIGTGTGAVAAAALARGCLVVAGDPEPDMLAMAALTAPGAELILAGLPELTGIEAGFDLITANCVLNQLAQPEASLRRLAELLRPGGRLAISTWPARHPLQQLWDDVVRQADAQIPESARRTARTGGMERTLDGVTAAVQRAGLLIERAWLHDFTHVVDQERWWSGPTRGVAWIGQVYAAQLPPKAAAMDEAYGRLSASYRGADGLLHLPATAIMVVATRPS
jgi:Methylase involved in ubiquinone/menaquinone biosynthesis